MQDRKQLYSIQILRGLAATAVLIALRSNIRAKQTMPSRCWVFSAFSMFFVIGGFIIAYVNADGHVQARWRSAAPRFPHRHALHSSARSRCSSALSIYRHCSSDGFRMSRLLPSTIAVLHTRRHWVT